jgi:membrane protein required for colicin V production
MNALDILIIGVIVLSGLLAFARGFVKEALSIAGWLGATAAAAYAMPVARPFAERFLPAGAVADAVAAGVIFIVTLIVLSIVTSRIARRVKHSSLSAVDRTLGLIFGLARGALLVAIGSIALFYVLPRHGDQPRWVSESRTLPLVESTTASLAQLLPASLRKQAASLDSGGTLNNDYLSVLRAYSVPGMHPGAGGLAIAPEDQRRLNQLIQQIGASPAAASTKPDP